MKRSIILLSFMALIGAIAWLFLGQADEPIRAGKANVAADTTRGAAGGAKTAEGKLTPESIKTELARTGRVVRSKARVVGERMDDARIIAVIKGKYVMDKNLSVLAISVDCRDGEVLLRGSVTSEDNIGRAVTLALQTGGVHHVESELVVKN
ncbi:MAG: BON domain-containing protein [Opitutae bacterium]|nr:BON domain-containing protein [Opitutae bacterium]